MALLDFLKNKKSAEKAKRPAKASVAKKVEKTEKKVEAPKAAASAKATAPKTGKFSYEAVKFPHISEKATNLAEGDQYTFEVMPGYNKNEIRKAVEGLYNVDVLSVNIIKIPAKKRRLGKTQGFRKAYKKAVVKIKNGQKIEIL